MDGWRVMFSTVFKEMCPQRCFASLRRVERSWLRCHEFWEFPHDLWVRCWHLRRRRDWIKLVMPRSRLYLIKTLMTPSQYPIAIFPVQNRWLVFVMPTCPYIFYNTNSHLTPSSGSLRIAKCRLLRHPLNHPLFVSSSDLQSLSMHFTYCI